MSVAIPGSKSLTARLLVCAAASEGVTTICRPLVAADTVAMLEALTVLGYGIERAADDAEWRVTGSQSGPPRDLAEVQCEDAGTVARFLPAIVAAGHGRYRFDASAQLRARPLAGLIDALRRLGAGIDAEVSGLPFTLVATGLRGGDVTVASTISSQFLSALCMAAPLAREPTTIMTSGLVSRPYVAMTLATQRLFGVTATWDSHDDVERIGFARQRYRPGVMPVEPDASSASYFFAAATLCGHSVTVPGLGAASVQGDLAFIDILKTMGADVNITADATTVSGVPGVLHGAGTVTMTDISDTMMTLAAIAPFADSPTRIEGIGNTRVKESDRIEAVVANLRALDVRVRSGEDWIEIWPSKPAPGPVACRRDHRIAMAFSVLGLRVPGITLDDPSCVEKTFPAFHAELRRVATAWGL